MRIAKRDRPHFCWREVNQTGLGGGPSVLTGQPARDFADDSAAEGEHADHEDRLFGTNRSGPVSVQEQTRKSRLE